MFESIPIESAFKHPADGAAAPAAPWAGGATPATRPVAESPPRFDSAPVFGGGGPGGGAASVDTHALLHFVHVLDQLQSPVQQAIDRLAQVQVRPGNFTAADRIIEKVSGPGGLRTTYTDNLTKLRDGLKLFGTRLRELAGKYDTIEELNSAGAAELAALINEAGSIMPLSAPAAAPRPLPSA